MPSEAHLREHSVDADGSYARVLRELFGLRRFGVKLDLSRPRAAAARLGNPHLRLPVLHVAGTNGKGSVAAFSESILRAAGLKTGLYTSPHLCRFTERIRVDGQEIPKGEVVRLYRRVSQAGPQLTFFERATLLALAWFAEQGVDVAVVETGLGGRLDATNLVRPAVCVITSIQREHTAYLGSDLGQIAWEKAGILKVGVPAVLAPGPQPKVRRVLRSVAEALGIAAVWVPDEAAMESTETESAYSWRDRAVRFAVDSLPLAGTFQRLNAAAAVTACLLFGERVGLSVTVDAVRRGLGRTRWPGRVEYLAYRERKLLLDAAHNPGSARALAEHVRAVHGRVPTLLFGTMEDKEADKVLPLLADLSDRVVLTRVPYYRAARPEELRGLLAHKEPVILTQHPADGLDAGLAATPQEGVLLVAGSVFLVGAVRALVTGEEVDPVLVTDPVGHLRYVGDPLEAAQEGRRQ